MHSAILRRHLGALLVASAFTLTLALSPAAHAMAYHPYSCTACAQENGPEEHVGVVLRNEVFNYSGKGVCSVVWENIGGGKFKEWPDCSSTATEVIFNLYGEYYGHGQVRRYYAQYSYNLGGVESEN